MPDDNDKLTTLARTVDELARRGGTLLTKLEDVYDFRKNYLPGMMGVLYDLEKFMKDVAALRQQLPRVAVRAACDHSMQSWYIKEGCADCDEQARKPSDAKDGQGTSARKPPPGHWALIPGVVFVSEGTPLEIDETLPAREVPAGMYDETPTPQDKHYEIVGAHTKQVIGCCSGSGIADVIEQEPGATFREVTKAECSSCNETRAGR